MPRPVHIGRKARNGIVEEACLDILDVSEDFHDCVTPEALYEVHEEVGRYLAFIRELDAGELSDWRSVDRTRKLLDREKEFLIKNIGIDAAALVQHPEMTKEERAERKATVRRRVKQLGRLTEARRECRRWMDEHLEEDRTRRAEEQLSGGRQ
jgi:hypothetical protein